MKLSRTLLATVAATLVASAAHAQSPAAWSAATDPFQIADDLYYVGTEGISVFLLTTPDGHVVIDGAMPTSAPLIEASIRKLGFDPKDVKILLNSHAHFDHAAGLAQLKADTGAILAASAEDKPALETGKYIGSEDVALFDFAPVNVDRMLADGDVVELGGLKMTAHLTPGHTAGCTTWTFPVTIAGEAHQAMLYCSTSVAANRLVSKDKGPQYPGIVAAYEASFAKLKTMKADVFLAPHPEQFDLAEKRAKLAAGGPNPFVDPTELQAAVSASEKDFHRQLDRQTEAAK